MPPEPQNGPSRALRIVILTNVKTRYFEKNYLLQHLSDVWVANGHRIILINDLHAPIPMADVVFLHIDLTTVPTEYMNAVRDHPVVVNKGVASISKRSFSTELVHTSDAYDGPVIVKTCSNYGGLPERNENYLGRFSLSGGGPLTFWRYVESLKKYPIYRSKAAVPRGVWKNRNLVVEKFQPERAANGDYCLRQWIFLGDQDIHYISHSRERVIKSDNIYKRIEIPNDEVPDSLRAVRDQLRFDYGKFDYAIHKGNVILYDINKTPGVPKEINQIKNMRKKIEKLSGGINYYRKRVVIT